MEILGAVVYDPQKKGEVKKFGGQTVLKSRGGSLAVGTYLQKGSAPPPPPATGIVNNNKG